MRVLIIEDDDLTSDYIASGLKGAGHNVDALSNGLDGLQAALEGEYDAIILDRMLPGMDGLSVMKSVRANGNGTPVLFLTAIGDVDDRVEGLEAGADDYLVKPFAFSELAARLAAIARRPPPTDHQSKLKLADLEVDLITRRIIRAGVEIELLPREFALLEYFMRNEGRVLSKTMLLEKVWGFYFDPQTSVVETHISRLRAKIDKPFDAPLIHTIKNVGYLIRAPH